ncbi:DNA-binding response regulator [Pseudomonas gingeri NCPPB 3146 = LMG 5327]|uniref:Response regulator transcription factor n=2 Tax=Pseudomonas gingeri TaxID=117681 RepID=A0A7Y7Y5V1_9PSED|nr:response regulator transcription factor [Pseudomonas gingeri]NWC18289.1 response regulator transcription factor [Pseudomonas gingeri]NWE46256.1 response regulator transcription factor [Pseudomonas gingeri]NWE69296.1 response regulator transcription factor [Pseudomonas gingeri]PNQ90436.1 DNA-binding response regulator [Pseudomonas gingeri NCPPB 3146 = LMG 5327]
MSDTLLLIEDDRPLAQLTAEFLRSEGFDVSIEHRGDRAVRRIREEQPALLILDVMLPGLDGFSLCREIRAEYPGLILMMTALDENTEQLVGFDVGADDYVVKPIDPLLLLARIRALLRRHRQAPPQGYEFGAFKLDAKNRRAWLNDTALAFSASEYELLDIFSRQPGVPLTREKLLQQLRGLEYDGLNRSIDMRVSRLRKKLVGLECPVTIQTVPAQGYLFVEIGPSHAGSNHSGPSHV